VAVLEIASYGKVEGRRMMISSFGVPGIIITVLVLIGLIILFKKVVKKE